MRNLRKRLSKQIKPSEKVKVLIGMILLLMLVIGCSPEGTDEDRITRDTEEEIIQEETDTSVSTDTEEIVKEEEVEEVIVAPVERKNSLSGGTQVVTPSGITIDSFEAIVINDNQKGIIELSGLELKKSYDIILSGTTSKQTTVLLYLLDGSQITRVEDVDLDNEVILDYKEFEVFGDFDENLVFTNSVMSTDRGVLYFVLSDTNGYFKNLEVKRHIGQLKFADEFDYQGLPSDDWTYEVGGNGWGNGELQYYTGSDLDNAKVDNGQLTITAMEENIDNNDYTSARMRTKDSFIYGRYEIRAKLPYGRGTWPAIWMLPAGNNYGNWPNSGEIDIMEHVGHDMDVVHASLHMAEFNFRNNNHPTSIMTIPSVDSEFHTYSLEWTPYQIDMYIDDYQYMTFKNDGQGPKHWPFDEKFYLLLNIAVGGAWGGQEGIDPIFPQEMVLDYVRIYDLEDQVVDTMSPESITEASLEVQGASVFYDFPAVEDNYKVESYEITLENNGDAIISESLKTNGFVFGLKEDSDYKVLIVAIDGSGNKSIPYETTIRTESVTVNKINEWIRPEDSYFVSGASISELESDNYISGFETDDLMAYRFDIMTEGNYKLELEISGKLFDGEVTLLNNEQEELLSFVASKTGDKALYEIVSTEVFELLEGQQTLFLKTIKNGYQIKNVRLTKED